MSRRDACQRQAMSAQSRQQIEREPEHFDALPAALHDTQAESHGANFQRLDRFFNGFGGGRAHRFNALKSTIQTVLEVLRLLLRDLEHAKRLPAARAGAYVVQ